MCNKYIVNYFFEKQTFRGVKTLQIHVEANSVHQAIEIAKMHLKYGQKIKKSPHISSVDIDNS